MVSRCFLALLGLCLFTLLASWCLRLEYELKQWQRTPVEVSYKKHGSDSRDALHGQNVSRSVPKPRVLCWIPTGLQNHMTRSIHVKRTWGSRCDKLLFMSNAQDPRLGTVALDGVQEGHDKLWPKTQKAFQYIWEHHKNDADWFMKADDDTYVFVDNLRRFLTDFDPYDPHYFGSESYFFKTAPRVNFGGTGYVLSREAVRRFVNIALVKGGRCFTGLRPDYKADEDTELGICLHSVGVPTEFTLDHQRRNRFWWTNPFKMFSYIEKHYEHMWDEGPLAVSNRAIAFHPISPQELYVLEYLTYYLKTDY